MLKRFLKIHDNKTLARKMIMEVGEEQIAKNLDYVEQQMSQGKVKSAPAFLKAAVQNNYISENERQAERRSELDKQAQTMRMLEEAKAQSARKAREIDRAYSSACIDAIQMSFDQLDPDTQKQVKDEFLESESFGSFQVTDFRRNGWASRMTLSPAIKFWMGRKAPCLV